MRLVWIADWALSLPLIALTLIIHVSALIAITALLARIRPWIETRRGHRMSTALFAIGLIGTIAYVLVALHGLAAAIWAGVYVRLGALDTLADAMLYSVDSMAARGASGLTLAPQWRLMGALEAVNGLLLFGITTAFLAALLTEIWKMLRKRTGGSR
jgi:hypothetical protein